MKPSNTSLLKNNIKLKVTSKDNKENYYNKNGNKSSTNILSNSNHINNVTKDSNSSPPNPSNQIKKRAIS